MGDPCSGRAHVFVKVQSWVGVRVASYVVEDPCRLVESLGTAAVRYVCLLRKTFVPKCLLQVEIQEPRELNVRNDILLRNGKIKGVTGVMDVSLLMNAEYEGSCELCTVPQLSTPSKIRCQLFVRIPDGSADVVTVDLRNMPRDDNVDIPVPRAPFRIQNLCGSQLLQGCLNIDILNPVLTQRGGTLSGSLMEILTPGGTFTFRRNRACVDFKGARKIAHLMPDLRVATCGACDGMSPPHVYMAVMRGALGGIVEFRDPFNCYIAEMSRGWCYARHDTDKLNGHPTLDLVKIKWDVLLSEYKGICDYKMFKHLRECKSTRFKISRRGWVLMYTIFKKGGIPWDEDMEDQFVGLANFALCRIAAIATGRERPPERVLYV